MQAGSVGSVCCLAFLVSLFLRATSAIGPPHLTKDLYHNVSKRSTSDNDDNTDLKSEAIQDENERVTATEDSISLAENEPSEAMKTEDRIGFLDLSEPASLTGDLSAHEMTSQDLIAASADGATAASNEPSSPPADGFAGSLRRGANSYGSGAEELITCSREGDMYSLRTPWNECLVCACMLHGGRVQPVCANCASCKEAPDLAPAPIALVDVMLPPSPIEPELQLLPSLPVRPTQLLPFETQPVQTLLPAGSQPCAPLPYDEPFDHPLNPCQVCICRPEVMKRNEVLITCIEDTQCVHPTPIPRILPTPIVSAPLPTPLCNMFPVDVVFPHPTEACKLCKCQQFVNSFNIPERKLLCIPDLNCGINPLSQDVLVPESVNPLAPTQDVFVPESVQPIAPIQDVFVPASVQPLAPSPDLVPSLDVESYAEADSPPEPINVMEIVGLPPEEPPLPQKPTLLPFLQGNPSDLIPIQHLPYLPSPDSNIQLLPPRPPVFIPDHPDPALPFTEFQREPELVPAPPMPPIIPFQPARPEILQFPQKPPTLEFLPPLPAQSVPTQTQPESFAAPPFLSEQIDVEAFAEDTPARLPDTIQTYPSLPSAPTQLIPQPGSLQEPLPWPPLTIPAQRKKGPLLGPPPHQSCQPFPANIPFQHPWDTCQVCVCAEYSSPGQISIEVNCYTKSSCCLELLEQAGQGQLALPNQVSIQGQVPQTQLVPTLAPLQLLDNMCELKTFGVEFQHPRDPCQVCACRPVGTLVVPQCRRIRTDNERCIAPASSILYIEPRCQQRIPDKPFLVGCSVCICQVIYTFVIAKCTPQPKCIQNMGGDLQVQVSADASADGDVIGGGGDGNYNQVLISPAPASAIPAANTNLKPDTQGIDYFLYGQTPQGPIQGYQQIPNLIQAQNNPNLYTLYGQNRQNPPTNFFQTIGAPDIKTQLYTNPAYQQGINYGPPRNTPSEISAPDFLDAINKMYQQKYHPQPYAQYPSKYLVNQPEAEIAIDSQSILYPSNSNGYLVQQPFNPYLSLLRPQPETAQALGQAVAHAQAQAQAQAVTQAQAQVQAIAQAQAQAQAIAQAHAQVQAQALAQAQAQAQAQLLAGYTRTQAEADSSGSDNLYNTQTYNPYARSWDPKQIEATTLAGQPPWETTTLEYDRGEAGSGSRALLQALADAGVAVPVGADTGPVVRTGRGLCQYAGDMYHHRCQACYCLADTGSPGELYSICLGNPCH